MVRLLRVAEGEPPIIFRFTDTPGETPRGVLERSQVAIRKAMKGGLEAGPTEGLGAGGNADAAGGDGKRKGKEVGKHGG